MKKSIELPRDPVQRRATELLNAVMNYARLILRRYGELPPCGFVMDREGQVFRETVDLPRLPPDPARLWKLLGERMADRVRRGQLQGAAIAANVTLTQPSKEGYTDAVMVTIEQEGGAPLEITVPYKVYGGQLRNLLPRRIAFGTASSEESVCRIFPELS